MEKPVEWHLWSATELVEALPRLVEAVRASLEDLPGEHRRKNESAVVSLSEAPPTIAQVRDGSRSRDLVTLGFALDVLGRVRASQGDLEASLGLHQAAHEMFRGANPLFRATRPMRQALGNALRVLILREAVRAERGETHAGRIREGLEAFIRSAWGFLPAPLGLVMNDQLLAELERIRREREADSAFHERFVRDNIEGVLTMEVPTRSEAIRDRWETLAETLVPAAARRLQRTVRRPAPLSQLIPAAVWAEIQRAVERGDAQALGHALGGVEDDLQANLRLRLDASTEYREPASEIRVAGGPDPAFLEARALLLRQDAEALDRFSNIHYRRGRTAVVKEWYAYALALFGRPTDIHDIIDLLAEAVAAEPHRPDRGWTARWNLACALRRLSSRAHEALEVLLPVLDQDAHTAEAFDLCLLWALEQERHDILPLLLVRSRYPEAHLLAALFDVEGRSEGGSPPSDHFRRMNRILRAPDRVFPDPRERLSFDELDQLTRDFVEASLVPAGVEWFRQRVAYGTESRMFKNWECAAALNEAAGDLRAAWRCRLASWRSTQQRKHVDPRKKAQVLRAVLGWAQRHGFQDEALRLLKQCWRETAMAEADARIWEERLGRAATPEEPAGASPVQEPSRDRWNESAAPGDRAPRPAQLRGSGPAPQAMASGPRPLALMLDWENVKISLTDLLREMPEGRAQTLRPRLAGPELAQRLLEAAWRHGTPRQRWAVADWDRPSFEGDQKAVKAARFWPDIAGGEKFNSSDHVLREKIHHVLREHPEIELFVIGTGDGDFHEVIRTLQGAGKRVILWATRRSINQAYGESLLGADRIQIEWLEDFVFSEEADPPGSS
jgi:hypothetical protein